MTQFDFERIQMWLKTFPENIEQALSTCPKCRRGTDKAWRHCANYDFRLSQDIRCKKCKRNLAVDSDIVVVGYEWADYNGGRLSEDATEWHDLVANRLTADQRAEAQRLAREWDEAHPWSRLSWLAQLVARRCEQGFTFCATRTVRI